MHAKVCKDLGMVAMQDEMVCCEYPVMDSSMRACCIMHHCMTQHCAAAHMCLVLTCVVRALCSSAISSPAHLCCTCCFRHVTGAV